VLFAVAAAIRVVVALQLRALPLVRQPQLDALEYDRWATRIAAGDWSWPVPPPHAPGYPFFRGLLLALTHSPTFVLIVQALLGAGTCVLVAAIGTRLLGERAGWAAGAILALYAPLIVTDVSIAAEGLLLFLIAAAMLAVMRENAIAAGALIGLATIVRPTALVLLPVAFFALRRRALLVATCLAPIAAVCVVNFVATRSFIPVQAYSGFNFYLGNSPLRDGLPSARLGGDWERLEPETARRSITSSSDADRYDRDKALHEIAQQPLAYVRLLAMKSARLVQDTEIRDSHSFYFFRDRAVPLRVLPTFTILFALAACGAWAIDWRAPGARALAAYLALWALTCIGLVVGSRYRMPLAPGLALLAGAGIVNLLTKRWLIIVAIVAGAATRLLPHRPSYDVAEEQALTAQSLLANDDVNAATAAANEAERLDPRSALAADTLGLVYANARNFRAAKPHFARALALNDSYSKAHAHLGQLALAENDIAGATKDFVRAAELDPRDADVNVTAARLAAGANDLPMARHILERTLVFNARHGGAMLLLANVTADLHDLDAARTHLRDAQAYVDPTPESRYMTAVVQYKIGAYADAEQMLTMLAADDPSNAAVQQLLQATRDKLR
jgi:tetratricopeptide (TPR) repeat protein